MRLVARVSYIVYFFFFSSRRRHTRFDCDWSSDVCSSDLSRFSLDGDAGHASVTAPRLLLETRRVYLARTPDLYRGGGGVHRARRRSRSRSGERRVGEEGRSWGAPYHLKKKKKKE